MYTNRIKHLKEMHSQLDKLVDRAEIDGVYNDADLNNMKKQRLRYRDEISRLTKLQWEDEHETVNFEDDR